jgi:3-oxoacyl-[acyl-carrier protein] reductase
VFCGRSEQDGSAFEAEVNRKGPGRAVFVRADVTREGDMRHLIHTAIARFGRIDCLINNAGVVRDRTTLRMSAEEFDEVVATNLRGTWLAGREAARAMRSTGGHIVNVLSHAAFVGSFGQSNYAASKGGAAALTRSWAYELARYGIRANAVCPVVLTDMTRVVVERAIQAAEQSEEQPPSAPEIGLGDPAEVAKMLVFLASDLASGLNGQAITFNGGRLALWTHPREVEVGERECWTVQEIADAFNGPDAAEQQAMRGPDLKPLPGPER